MNSLLLSESRPISGKGRAWRIRSSAAKTCTWTCSCRPGSLSSRLRRRWPRGYGSSRPREPARLGASAASDQQVPPARSKEAGGGGRRDAQELLPDLRERWSSPLCAMVATISGRKGASRLLEMLSRVAQIVCGERRVSGPWLFARVGVRGSAGRYGRGRSAPGRCRYGCAGEANEFVYDHPPLRLALLSIALGQCPHDRLSLLHVKCRRLPPASLSPASRAPGFSDRSWSTFLREGTIAARVHSW